MYRYFTFFLFLLVPSYELINSDARHDSVDWITCICCVVVDCGSTRCDSTDHCSRLSHLCHCMKLSHFTCIFEFFFFILRNTMVEPLHKTDVYVCVCVSQCVSSDSPSICGMQIFRSLENVVNLFAISFDLLTFLPYTVSYFTVPKNTQIFDASPSEIQLS